MWWKKTASAVFFLLRTQNTEHRTQNFELRTIKYRRVNDVF